MVGITIMDFITIHGAIHPGVIMIPGMQARTAGGGVAIMATAIRDMAIMEVTMDMMAIMEEVVIMEEVAGIQEIVTV